MVTNIETLAMCDQKMYITVKPVGYSVGFMSSVSLSMWYKLKIETIIHKTLMLLLEDQIASIKVLSALS